MSDKYKPDRPVFCGEPRRWRLQTSSCHAGLQLRSRPRTAGIHAVEAHVEHTAGNFEYDANPRDVERLFDRFGPIERLDMKTGEHASLITSRVAPTGLCSMCLPPALS